MPGPLLLSWRNPDLQQQLLLAELPAVQEHLVAEQPQRLLSCQPGLPVWWRLGQTHHQQLLQQAPPGLQAFPHLEAFYFL